MAYIRVVHSYEEGVIKEAFERMVEWAKQKSIYESEVIFGMSIDDPYIAPQKKIVAKFA